MRTINLDELLVTLDLIIDDEDTKDRQIGHAVCRHFSMGKPQCLVGQLFTEYGVDQYTLPTSATTRLAGGAMDYLQRHGVLAFTSDAQDFIRNLQSQADRNITWREAYDNTCRIWRIA